MLHKFTSQALKTRINSLYESIDRKNATKMIVEKYYSELCALDLAEGQIAADDALNQLKSLGVSDDRARNMVAQNVGNKRPSTIADAFLLDRVRIVESLCKELNAYNWMPNVESFITEMRSELQKNEVALVIERTIYGLERTKTAGYYSKAISGLRDASRSANPVMSVVETLESEKWIPSVKQLYEYCSKLIGSVTGNNPNFKISRLYSPIEESNGFFRFNSSGLVLETNGKIIRESKFKPSSTFIGLSQVSESATFTANGFKLYPNSNSVLDIEFNEAGQSTIRLNNAIVESEFIDQNLVKNSYIRVGDSKKRALIQCAIHEGSKIKELDFGYKVASKLYEGVSVSVFTMGDKVYLHKINPAMHTNELSEGLSAQEAIDTVKAFMNYDITESVAHLQSSEKLQEHKTSTQIQKIQSRIKFLNESLSDLNREMSVGSSNSKRVAAKKLLLEELDANSIELAKLGGAMPLSVSETFPEHSNPVKLVPGSKYTINSGNICIYQGYTGGKHIFNDISRAQYFSVTDAELDSLFAGISVAESCELVPGAKYTINNVPNCIYQGFTSGKHIFNATTLKYTVGMTPNELDGALKENVISYMNEAIADLKLGQSYDLRGYGMCLYQGVVGDKFIFNKTDGTKDHTFTYSELDAVLGGV